MNANTNGRLNKTRRTPNLTVAPVTRAIRSALAISATLLALGGSGAAIAQGTCTFTTPTTVSCDGAFTTTVPGTFFTPVADLTLVMGDTAPTSVTPAAGLMGIDANWSGSVGVTSYADITTVGATGIFAYSTYTATVSNQGSITTNVTASGAKAMDINAYGDVSVVNNGPVNAYSTGVYDVTAVNAYSSRGTVSVDNQSAGTITATAQDGNAIAVNASGYSAVTVTNEGAITASSVNGIAVDILAQSYNGNVNVTNSGGIVATSTDGQAVGVLASGDTAYVLNSGSAASITVTSGPDAAVGIEAYGHAGANVFNTGGSITVTSNGGTATGILAEAYKGAARITNTGSIQVTSLYYSPAVGVEAYSAFSGAADVTNSGSIAATAVSGSATAILVQAHYGRATVVNSGNVSATAGAGTNYYQHNRAIGIVASSGAGYSPGITTVTNSGNITASGPLGEGIVGSARYGDLTITNAATGTITAYGQNEAIGIGTGQNVHNSFGRYIDDFTFQADIYNAGSITAVADSSNCTGCTAAQATGIQVFLNQGNNVTITNSGAIAVSALGNATEDYVGGFGIDAVTDTGNITIGNSGRIAVVASNNTGNAFSYASWGINANTYKGDISIVNAGDLSVSTSGPTAFNRGINAYSKNGDISIVNSGNISLTSSLNANPADTYATLYLAGISVTNPFGAAVAVSNSGDITIDSVRPVNATGILVEPTASYVANDSVTNSGHITINGENAVNEYGIQIAGVRGGAAIVDNSGSITVTNSQANGPVMGMNVHTGSAINGTNTITNSGDIAVSGGTKAMGVYTQNGSYSRYYPTGHVVFNNSGSISASIIDELSNATSYQADAIGAQIRNADSTTVTNSGSITATMSADPTGGYGYGRVTATGLGVLVFPGFNFFPYDGVVSITNTGSITASVTSNGATIGFLPNDAMGIRTVSTYAAASVINSGTITATAQTDASTTSAFAHPFSAIGVFMSTSPYLGGGSYSLADMTVSNGDTGSITASSTSNYGAVATNATGIGATLGLSASFLVGTDAGITIDNAGLLSATATVGGSDTLGSATATGVSAFSWSDGFVNITNTGAILATATTPGVATATGISATGYSVAVALNTGSLVSATATGASGTATGLSLTNTGIGALTASNAGVLMATFNGAGGKAYGAVITSGGDINLTNTDHILASNATSAVGVDFNSPTNVTLTNSGTIIANSAAAGSVAVLSTGASNVALNNSGTITGSIQTGAGNDSLTNAVGGVWNAVGASDFGAGDDTVTNAGTINLNNTTISLGSDPTGNQFGNAGLITVVGSNTITMGTGTTVNPNPFTNNGTINFQNGAANNTLTIVGNFAGNGQLDMDVNGATSTGDLLKINGNVATGSVNTVNVNLLTDPTTASTTIPLVQVSGTSATGSFVLGTFTQPKGFLGLSEALVSTPNLTSLGLTVAAAAPPPPVTPPPPTPPPGTPPPITPPPVNIAVTVSGLSQLGTLAASAAPGVQSLMNSQIGTLEDRMGAVSQAIKGGLSLWTRAFADSGTVDPDHSAGNFGQNGDFGFDQSNSGDEVGLDFAISDAFKAGALFAKSQANQSLDGNEADSSQIRGNTAGVYGTWISTSGFYVDASYRWMTFNDRLHAPTGYASIHGNADAFNLEVGRTWTLQNGLQIAPQFQYTLTKVDNINAQTGNLAGFQSTGDDASRARLGVMFSKEYTPASSNAVWMPYASLSVVQELDGKNSYAVDNTFFGETDTRGTSVLAETGLNVQFGKLSVFGGLNWQDGGALKSFFGGQVGLRYTF